MTILEKTKMQISEQDLILLLKDQNTEGMEVLYDRYASRIYGIIRRIIPMEDFAENVLNDSLLKIWKNIHQYDSRKGRFLTWMLNIARNTAIDELRSKRYLTTTRTKEIESLTTFPQKASFELKIENIDVKDFVNKLAPKYQKIIELIYFQGYTHAEVSKELELPLGTVKGRVRKAFTDLRILLK